MRILVLFLPLALIAGCGTDGLGTGGNDPDLAPAVAPDMSELPDLASSKSGIGDPCTGGGGLSQGSCADGQVCVPDGQFGNTDGYCVAQCGMGTDCPSDATCIEFGTNFAFCLLTCTRDSQCRQPDYSCQNLAQGKPRVCAPTNGGGGSNSGGPTPGTRDGGLACVTPVVKPTPGIFGANTQLSPGGANTRASEVQLNVDALNKNVVVSWIDLGNTGGGIGAAHSGDDGASWGNELTLPIDKTVDKNSEQSDPVVAVDGLGNFWVVWVGFDRSAQNPNPANMHMFAARSKDGGITFPDLFQLAPNAEWPAGGFLDKPWIAASRKDATVYATWARATAAGAEDIRMVRFDGAAWGAPVSINDVGKRGGVSRNLAQVVVADDGHPMVTWVEVGQAQYGSTANQVYVQRFNPDGSKLANNVLVTHPPDSPPFEDPSIAVFGPNVYVGFSSGDSKGAWDILVAASTDGGATFQKPVKANDDDTCATHFHHQIVVDGRGNVHAIWFDNRYLDGNVMYAMSPPADPMVPLAFGKNSFVNDKAFTFTTRRDQANWLGDYLGLATYGGEIYAAWTDNRTTNRSQIYFAKGQLK